MAIVDFIKKGFSFMGKLDVQNSVFYKYYLDKEIKRRNEALNLLAKGDFHTLRNNYVHYLIKEVKEELITDTNIISLIDQLNEIKNKLPVNSYSPEISFRTEGEDRGMYSSNEVIFFVSWTQYSIEGEDKCTALAKCWARDDDWKMRNQPDGIDGKRAIVLFEKLTKESETL